jgi:hypothetical protein
VEIQRSPNRWSCLPTAFAMVLRLPVAKVIAGLTHDGSEVAWPQLPEPLCRRGFHIQELIFLAWEYKKFVTPFEAIPLLTSQGQPPIDVPFTEPPQKRLAWIMAAHEGVITGLAPSGMPHACSWDRSLCLDPNGTRYPVEKFTLETFWLVR